MRPFRFKEFVTLESIDLNNSVLWFFMDSMWLFDLKDTACVLFIPTFITALWVVLLAQSKELRLYTMANSCWVLVNGFWLFNETFGLPIFLTLAKSFFFVGTSFLILFLFTKGVTPSSSLAKK